ncbi:hypothetical protein SAMN04489727_0533 [Amycolatopsis tolypomycina]|uniref:Uncharacterized protein n=1 Tax=Amycolatopsis tolypomycina TaxID=208445 RepID=A0A1H4IEM4_9PSEU|nr:hypothetical protein [Amycolatopsis tolypomycina]SEB32549.1 hypothetical protein SAMN04489727_0533 [Amycolatopsis tolypomycina]
MNYPQQPGQPYPHQQQPYGQYPPQQYPGYPQPPKKGNGLLIGLLVGGGALLLVVVFVITGFVAPGFLVSDSKPKVASGPPLDLNSGSVVAGKFILAVMGDDPDEAEEAACASAKSQVRQAATKLGSANAQITAGEPTQGLDNQIMVKLTGTMNRGRTLTGSMTVQREANGTYCIAEITTSA